MIITKYASQEISWQILVGSGLNLLADLVIVTTSASKKIYWQKLGKAVNLLVDLVTLTKSGSQGNLQAEMVRAICWQI